MEALGRLFDGVLVGDGVRVHLKDASHVAFLCVNAAGDTWTVQEANAKTGGTAQDLDVIDHWYVQTNGDGTDQWTAKTQTADAAVVTASTEDVAVIEVDAAQLSDGFEWISCASTSTGTVVALVTDLTRQRKPILLPVLND